MEVHKHPHDVSHKKKWSEYLLEFLMIFFAVFLGFLAENIREDRVESRREIGYMKAMIEDLQYDTMRIDGYINFRSTKSKMMDSLAALLVSNDSQKGGKVYYFARYVTQSFPLITADGALQQLKNSGGFRLIKKQVVVDSIVRYDANVKYIQYLNSKTEEIENTFRQMAGAVFDARNFAFAYSEIAKRPVGNPELLTSDQSVLNNLSIEVLYEERALERDIQNAFVLKERGVKLMELLRKEYHLK